MPSIKELDLPSLVVTVNSKDWSRRPLFFVGDVGGSYARLGFATLTQEHPTPSALHKFQVIYTRFFMTKKSIVQLKDFIGELLTELLSYDADAETGTQGKGQAVQQRLAALQNHPVLRRVQYGSLALPGPITHNGTVGGPFNALKGVLRLEECPTFLFPPGKSRFLNDIESGAYGLAALSNAGQLSQYMKPLWEGKQWREVMGEIPIGSTLGKGNCMVLAQGSGLGSAYIFYRESTDSYDVISTEVGSTTVPDLVSSRAYLDGLAHYLHLTANAVTTDDVNATEKPVRRVRLNCEQLTTGAALEYNYFCIVKSKSSTLQSKKIRHSPLKAGEIATLAKKGDPDALAAMTTMFENLMKICSEMNMLLVPLTFAFIGNNITLNQFFFEDANRCGKLFSTLLQHPMEQRHPGLMQRPTFLRQVKEINMNLIGCVGVALKEYTSASKSKL